MTQWLLGLTGIDRKSVLVIEKEEYTVQNLDGDKVYHQFVIKEVELTPEERRKFAYGLSRLYKWPLRGDGEPYIRNDYD
jgi:hypothetical protein